MRVLSCLAEPFALGGVFERADAAEGRAGSAVGVDGGATGSGAVAEGGGELGEGGVFEAEVAAASAGEIGGDAGPGEIAEGGEIPDAGNKEPARRAACFGDLAEVQEERGWGRGAHTVSILYGSWEGQGDVGSGKSDVGSGKWGVGSGRIGREGRSPHRLAPRGTSPFGEVVGWARETGARCTGDGWKSTVHASKTPREP